MTIRQLLMLGMFRHKAMKITKALTLSQRTFGTLCRHRWIAVDFDQDVFHITAAGIEEHFKYDKMDLTRATNNGRFSMYVPKKTRGRLVEMRKAG